MINIDKIIFLSDKNNEGITYYHSSIEFNRKGKGMMIFKNKGKMLYYIKSSNYLPMIERIIY